MDNLAAFRNSNILKPLRTESKDYFEQAENNTMSGNDINYISNCKNNTEENELYTFKDVKLTIVSDNEILKQMKAFSIHDFEANIKDEYPNIFMNTLAASRNYKPPKTLKTGSKSDYKLAFELISCQHI
jgi:hypothetical protein